MTDSGRRAALLTAAALLLPGRAAVPADPTTPSASVDLGPWIRWPKGDGTLYALEQLEDGPAIRADTNGGITSLYIEREFDLLAFPCLQFRWKTARHYAGLDERHIDGFDFPLRISVLYRTGIGKWAARSVNYVVASGRRLGERFEHPRDPRAVHVVIANREFATATWHAVAVNVRADFERHLDLRVTHAHGLAITVDNDSAGQSTTSWVSALAFAPSPAHVDPYPDAVKLPLFD